MARKYTHEDGIKIAAHIIDHARDWSETTPVTTPCESTAVREYRRSRARQFYTSVVIIVAIGLALTTAAVAVQL